MLTANPSANNERNNFVEMKRSASLHLKRSSKLSEAILPAQLIESINYVNVAASDGETTREIWHQRDRDVAKCKLWYFTTALVTFCSRLQKELIKEIKKMLVYLFNCA